MDNEVSTPHTVAGAPPPSNNHPPLTDEDDLNITEDAGELDESPNLSDFEEDMALWSVHPMTNAISIPVDLGWEC